MKRARPQLLSPLLLLAGVRCVSGFVPLSSPTSTFSPFQPSLSWSVTPTCSVEVTAPSLSSLLAKPTRGISADDQLAELLKPAQHQHKQHTSVLIRKCRWEDLQAASRLLVSEFYGQTMWFPAQCLSELNRLQVNYPYDGSRHIMLVAADPLDKSILGFVDIDARVPLGNKSSTPPRPYLSDLAVRKSSRRRGVGSQLVKECERVCAGWGHSNIYLKVQAQNAAGVGLYKSLGYIQARPIDEKDQLLLAKRLPVSPYYEAYDSIPPPMLGSGFTQPPNIACI